MLALRQAEPQAGCDSPPTTLQIEDQPEGAGDSSHDSAADPPLWLHCTTIPVWRRVSREDSEGEATQAAAASEHLRCSALGNTPLSVWAAWSLEVRLRSLAELGMSVTHASLATWMPLQEATGRAHGSDAMSPAQRCCCANCPGSLRALSHTYHDTHTHPAYNKNPDNTHAPMHSNTHTPTHPHTHSGPTRCITSWSPGFHTACQSFSKHPTPPEPGVQAGLGLLPCGPVPWRPP